MRKLSALFAVMTIVTLGLHVQSRTANAAPRTHAGPCSADSTFQRLSFWIGDWTVYDSLGVRYATQRVHPAVDGCALTIEWSSGGGNKGLGMMAYDIKSGEWKQFYVSNQLPSPSGVTQRRSDSTYHGAGVRFVSIAPATAGSLARSRVTIQPMSDHRALQLFEDSTDGGETWKVVFKAEHRAK